MSRPAAAETLGHDSALHNVETATRRWPFLLALVLQNLLIFRGHYFNGVGVPWDFSMAYYAMVAFWTTAVGGGTFPEWMPFQQMGYPFALQLQSGMNYLPLWAFPLFKIPYTLHAAIVFQCLHILFGSVGMFVLARMEQRSSAFALVAAVAFQFFGGFYSNAEHVDIIRAFAIAPWLLYVFTLDRRDPEQLPTRSILIPPIVYLFATGGYPGNVFAGGVIVPIYVGLQLADVYRRGFAPSRLTRVALSVTGLALLGCGMAILQYGPVWLHRTEFLRAAELEAIPREGLWFPHLAGLFLSNKTLPGEISMTSTYVSLPVLFFATFAPAQAIERHRVLVILGGIAMLMAAGDRSFPWTAVTTAIPVLKLSRFPSSDYRVFAAIPLILIALAGLRAIVEKQLSGKTIAVRSLVCVTWLCWGLTYVYHSMGRDVALAGVVAAASFATLIALWRTPPRFMPIGLCAVVLLISADALRVLPDVPGWREPEFDAWYARQGFPPYKTPRGRLLRASRILSDLPASRPARTVAPGLVRWGGYVDGRFLANDLTPNVLRATARVAPNSLYQQYMLMPWRPLVLEAPETWKPPDIVVPDTELAERIGNMSAIEREGVKQIRYGVNEIRYHVSLDHAQLLVENEIYFPGWRARLSTPDGTTLDAVSVNGVFRSWLLPAGTYTMDASFEFPRRSGLGLVTILSVLLWTGVVLVRWRGAPRLATDALGAVETSLKRECSVAVARVARYPRAASFVLMSALLLAFNISDTAPMFGDAAGYWSAARSFATDGNHFTLGGYADPLRGYSFPLMLYGVQEAARAVHVNDVVVFRIISAFVGSTLFAVVLPALFASVLHGRVSLVSTMVFCLSGVVYWCGHFLYALSDFPALLLLAIGLLCVHHAAGRRRWSTALTVASGMCLALSANVRPVNEIALLAASGAVGWQAIQTFGVRRAIPPVMAFVAGAAVVLGPQAAINSRNLGTRSPFAHGQAAPGAPNLYVQQLAWGIAIQRYETNVADGRFPVSVIFLDAEGQHIVGQDDRSQDPRVFAARRPLDSGSYVRLVAAHPLHFASAYARHLFNGLDVAYPTPYLTRVAPRTAWFALVNYLVLAAAGIGALAMLARVRPRVHTWPLVLLTIFVLPALVAIPTAIEPRFLLPLWTSAYGVFAFRLAADREWISLMRSRFATAATAAAVCVCFMLASSTYSRILGGPQSLDRWCLWQCESATTNSVRLAVDTPGPGSALTGPFVVAGWAIDPHATNDSGIDALHVWAQRSGGDAARQFVGAARVGVPRPDVAAVFGRQFAAAGFTLTVPPLAPGAYDLVVYPHRTATGAFESEQAIRVTVR